MDYSFPHTIDNGLGETIIFQRIEKESDGDKVIAENFVAPGQGPLMHTHKMQEEALTVIKGKIGYQVLGEEPCYAGEGETVLFKRGVSHKFWNAGNDTLHCKGWIKPANTIVFYLSSIYAAQKKSGNAQPEAFDAAFLLTRYRKEYDLPELPFFVKKVIIPFTYRIGQLLGKYEHFKNAPEPLGGGY